MGLIRRASGRPCLAWPPLARRLAGRGRCARWQRRWRQRLGLTLTLNIIMGGALTGAAFNPARARGPMVATGNFSDAWLYVSAPIVGAIVAAILHTGLARLAQERIPTNDHHAAAGTPAE